MTTMILGRPTMAALKFRLADLQEDRRNAFLWSDFAMTNGTIKRIDAEIGAIQAEIAKRENLESFEQHSTADAA